jgi:hypothetical protein
MSFIIMLTVYHGVFRALSTQQEAVGRTAVLEEFANGIATATVALRDAPFVGWASYEWCCAHRAPGFVGVRSGASAIEKKIHPRQGRSSA